MGRKRGSLYDAEDKLADSIYGEVNKVGIVAPEEVQRKLHQYATDKVKHWREVTEPYIN